MVFEDDSDFAPLTPGEPEVVEISRGEDFVPAMVSVVAACAACAASTSLGFGAGFALRGSATRYHLSYTSSARHFRPRPLTAGNRGGRRSRQVRRGGGSARLRAPPLPRRRLHHHEGVLHPLHCCLVRRRPLKTLALTSVTSRHTTSSRAMSAQRTSRRTRSTPTSPHGGGASRWALRSRTLRSA